MNQIQKGFVFVQSSIFAVLGVMFLCIPTTLVDAGDKPIGKDSPQDKMSGHDHSNQYKKKLLQFVPPIYDQPTVQSSLTTALSTSQKDSSQALIAAIEKTALASASTSRTAIQQEQQARIMEQSLKLQLLQAQGVKVSGLNSTIRTGGIGAKIMEIQRLTELMRAKQEAKSEEMKINFDMRQDRIANRLRMIKAEEIQGVTAKSGRFQNVLLSSMKSALLKYGYTLGSDPRYVSEFANLKLPLEDFRKIRLQLDDEGAPVSFPATGGAVDLGRLPTVMNHPVLFPIVRDIESQLGQIAKLEPGVDFYSATIKLSDALQSLEFACNKAIGTSRECAAKGVQGYRVWQSSKDYRDRLRGLLNRLELEGSSEILKSQRGRYDPTVQGDGILPFAKFVADNACKIAPASPGDEATYVRLLQQLRQLEVILEE